MQVDLHGKVTIGDGRGTGSAPPKGLGFQGLQVRQVIQQGYFGDVTLIILVVLYFLYKEDHRY